MRLRNQYHPFHTPSQPVHYNHCFCEKSHSKFQLLFVPNSLLKRKHVLIKCCMTKLCQKELSGAALELGGRQLLLTLSLWPQMPRKNITCISINSRRRMDKKKPLNPKNLWVEGRNKILIFLIMEATLHGRLIMCQELWTTP